MNSMSTARIAEDINSADAVAVPSPGLEVTDLSLADTERWDAFVHSAPAATFFHRAGWKRVIENAFGHECHYLVAQRDDQVEGVLPLVHIKSLLFGNSLSSCAFCETGGVVASNPEAASLLLKAACDLADRLQVDALELRNRTPTGLELPTKDLYVNFRKELHADPEENLKAIPRKQRAMVRKGINAGLQSELDNDWQRVHRVYAESVRNLGTPVFSARYFQLLAEEFGPDCHSLTVTHEGQDIAAVLSFKFGEEILPYYGGSIARARALKGNDFMYWELMRRSCVEGFRCFNYGRSKVGTGSYSFKKNWGFVAEPLFYEYHLVKADKIPEVNPANPKYQYFIKAWKKLPLPVANTLGPLLSRNLG